MISQYCAVGAVTGIFAWLNDLKYRKGQAAYSTGMCCLLYLVMRFGSIFTLAQRSREVFFCLAADLAILLLLSLTRRGAEKKRRAAALYIMNPVPLLCVLSGSLLQMAGVACAVVWLVLFSRFAGFCLTQRQWSRLYPPYLAVTASLFLLKLAVEELGQTFAQWVGDDGVFPVVMILALFSLAISLVLLGVSLIRVYRSRTETEETVPEGGTAPAPETEETAPEPEASPVPVPEPTGKARLRGRDYAVMLLLTAVFAALVFFRLGAFRAPETCMEMNQSSAAGRELVLDLGEEISVSKISVFLGVEAKKTVTVSTFDTESQAWQILGEGNRIIESVFCWNDVEIDAVTRYLGIVLLDESAYFNELVIVDENGGTVLPVNSDQYPLLFDEQEKYPEYATYYYRTMFDEVYHGRTAYEFLHDLPIYEISHPPLGKSLISIGVALFGMTPFGWRSVCALFGTLMVPLTYLFAWKITRKSRYAAFTAALLSLEFMHMTLSRIATVDILVAFFILLMFFLMYGFLSCWRENLAYTEANAGGGRERRKRTVRELLWALACGAATGCAIATKWTGVYAAAGLAVMLAVFMVDVYHGREKQPYRLRHLLVLFFGCVASFILLPLGIYVLSYIPFTQVEGADGLLATVIENGEFMLRYHEATIFDHPYSSEWYEWPWIGRPLLDALTWLEGDGVSTVATFGNPVVWWGGLAALLHNCYLWRMENDKTSRFLCLAYGTMLVPWLFIHRTVFIYQYFCCALVLVLMIGYSVFRMKKYRRTTAFTALGVALVLFLLFFPVLTGVDTTRAYVDHILEWLPGWTFA